MSARERILHRLRAVSTAPPPQTEEAIPEAALPEAWCDVLAKRLEEEGLSVYRAATFAAARLHLAAWLQDREVAEVVGWPPSKVGVPGLAETLEALGIRWEVALPPEEERPPTPKVAITGVHGVLWPAGTLLFVDSADTPIAPVVWAATHVAVVLPTAVYLSLGAWWRAVNPGGPVFAASGLARSWAFGVPPVAGGLTPRERHVVLVERAAE